MTTKKVSRKILKPFQRSKIKNRQYVQERYKSVSENEKQKSVDYRKKHDEMTKNKNTSQLAAD